MLINLSNHPYIYWGELQRREALERWGAVEDLPFPVIDPNFSRDELLPIVDDYFGKCKERYLKYGKATTFHVMGESVFCFHLINKLLAAEYRVVASAATRDVEYTTDGHKITIFNFIRFRAY